MKKMKDGAKCTICGGGVLHETKVDEVLRYKGQSKELTGLTAYLCDTCEDGFFDKESEKHMNKQFADLKREVEGLLTSDEIKRIRKTHALSQEHFSELLGMSPKTIARYENGIVVQSPGVDRMLRMIRDIPQNMSFLRDLLSKKDNEVQQQDNVVPFSLDYEPIILEEKPNEESELSAASLAA
tara:strand:+ start:1443 stop:1991 length:549 start_codon:yes stop_codon:yes gene_type:complete